MKKRTFAILLCVIVTAMCAVALFACDKKEAAHALNYDASEYGVYDRVVAEDVDSIDIEWLAGDVQFKISEDVERVEAYERGASDRGDMRTMHALTQDGKLFIKCAAPGEYKLEEVSKTLTVIVPADFCFESVTAATYSANVVLPSVMTKRTTVGTHTGYIVMHTAAGNMLTSPHSIALSTRTGRIELVLADNLVQEADGDGEVSLSTSSGNIDVKVNGSAPLMKVKTSTGRQEIELNATVYELDCDSVSGPVGILAKVAPLALNVITNYSAVDLRLNRDYAFELITNATLTVGTLDLSKGEKQSDGSYKYSYIPEQQIGSFKSKYSVIGDNSELTIERLKTKGEV